MMPIDLRTRVADSIEHAIADLADALDELDRIPATHDGATVGAVAHAMDNYLSVTDATLGLLGHALRDHPSGEVATWLEGLRRLGNMMHHTVERLVRSSATGEFQLVPEYIDVPVLMQRACEYYRPSAQRKQLAIVCRSVGDVPLAWADRVGVAVVADNLLSNAVKFSNDGPGLIVVQVTPGPGGVVCGVRDYGAGVDPIIEAQFFPRGAMASSAQVSNGQRSWGFGLAIARALVDRMGGKLWLDNDPGGGACFSFRLPYRPDGSGAAR
jgi:signal transduction histidine kinase